MLSRAWNDRTRAWRRCCSTRVFDASTLQRRVGGSAREITKSSAPRDARYSASFWESTSDYLAGCKTLALDAKPSLERSPVALAPAELSGRQSFVNHPTASHARARVPPLLRAAGAGHALWPVADAAYPIGADGPLHCERWSRSHAALGLCPARQFPGVPHPSRADARVGRGPSISNKRHGSRKSSSGSRL